MGCGQSKIGNIYSRNKKNKSNHSKKSNDSTSTSSIDQKNGNSKSNKTNNNGIEVNHNDDYTGSIDYKNLSKKKVSGSSSSNGPLLHQAEVSSSQVDFFRMLDEKIENGPDYDGSAESTVKIEHVTDLLHRWELASMIWPSVTDLRNTAAATTYITTKSSSNLIDESYERANIVKGRDTLRNIIGGRSEIAPVFARNANRVVDGLQDINSPSPNMPRHVLDSISQSPTQSLKNTSSLAGTSSSEYSHQCNEYIDENNVTSVNKMSSNRMNYQSQRNNDDENDYISPQVLYREQYLQQTGIISVQPQYQSGNIVRNKSYVQQFQRTSNEQHFQTPKKRNCNVAKMT